VSSVPHKCIKCGKVYPTGDSRILKGCSCGNRVFVYIPESKIKIQKRDEGSKELKSVKVDTIYDKIKTATDETRIESIRVLSPGCYEINLEKIINRKEIIIALGQEGVYLIHLPSILKTKKT